MMRRWLLWTLLLPLFCAGFGVGARAQTQTSISATCSVNYSELNFGDNIDILSNTLIETSSAVLVQCNGLTTGQAALVCLGMNPAATDPQMVNQNDNTTPLYYDIFTDFQHTNPWLSQQKKRPSTTVTFGNPRASIPFYGLIRRGQSTSPVGQYVATVNCEQDCGIEIG